MGTTSPGLAGELWPWWGWWWSILPRTGGKLCGKVWWDRVAFWATMGHRLELLGEDEDEVSLTTVSLTTTISI